MDQITLQNDSRDLESMDSEKRSLSTAAPVHEHGKKDVGQLFCEKAKEAHKAAHAGGRPHGG